MADKSKSEEKRQASLDHAVEAAKAQSQEADDRAAAIGNPDESKLNDEQIVLRRTAGDEWPLDGKYRKVFHIAVARTSTGQNATDDWRAPEYDSMHRANEVATLQEALNRGLHPRAEVELESAKLTSDPTVADLVYSVEVVPAAGERPEEAALAYTPSAAIEDMGGNTLSEQDRDAK